MSVEGLREPALRLRDRALEPQVSKPPLIERFHAMIRTKEADQLDTWLAEANPSLISSFATGIARDKSAVLAAITEPL